jgi:hypothetical protein
VSLSKGGDDKWRKAVFWVFDAPDIWSKPFEVCWFYYEDRLIFVIGKNSVFKKIKGRQYSSFLCKNCKYSAL